MDVIEKGPYTGKENELYAEREGLHREGRKRYREASSRWRGRYRKGQRSERSRRKLEEGVGYNVWGTWGSL